MDTAEAYVECSQGHQHWGRHGAAGVLFVTAEEPPRFLLQHRSPEVHEGDCWGLPGGALAAGETPLEGALRETEEELGALPSPFVYELLGEVVLAHGGWSYTTLLLRVPTPFAAEAQTWETGPEGYRWVLAEELAELPLHRGVAAFVAHELPALLG